MGPRDKAEIAARIIESQLQPVLLPATGDTLQDDMPMGSENSRVTARFDIGSYDKDFPRYGRHGLPFFNHDMAYGAPVDLHASKERAQAALALRYGTCFTGTRATPDAQ